MTINLSNGLVGLSLLTGGNSFQAFGAAGLAIETRAAREARELFTTPETSPPWKEPLPTTSMSAQVTAIRQLGTIIDKPAIGAKALPQDVQTAFTTYKALDRLRLLAETAAKTGTTATERASLQKTFANGLQDLQAFLGSAPSDKLQLSFGQPARRVESVPVLTPSAARASEIVGAGLVDERDAALPGMAGNEQFRITLSKSGASDSVTVDLSGTPQPPTIDSVSAAINGAIASVPMRDVAGNIVLDASGNPEPRWDVRFVADKQDGKWGFSIDRVGYEDVAIDQIGGGDTLMVAAGVTGLDAPTTTRIMRFDDPAGAMDRRTLGTVAGIDRDATAAAQKAKSSSTSGSNKGVTGDEDAAKPAQVFAETASAAVATDTAGFSYIVGTTAGDLGGNRSDGDDDLMLSKLDSEGQVVWQRALGAAGAAKGAAVSIGADGSIVVAGTVTGSFNGIESDGDLLVARFDALGDEKFATLVRSVGADSASAVAVGADGSVFVGGRSSGGGGNAFLARLDAAGRLQERRSIDSGGDDRVTALAIDGSGELLALTNEGGEAKLRRMDAASLATDLGVLSLGTADARALAVDADGSIAVGGATLAPMPGAQANAPGGGRDGFVARVDAGLANASVTYIGTASDDQVDSIAFMDGAIYAGGRTTGALNGERTGAVDGFVTRIDTATGAVENSRQFGQIAQRTEAVRVSAISGGNTVLGALGLHRGTITPQDSAKLVAQTGLRAGDEFAIRVDGGAVRKIVIDAQDTLTTLADRIRRITGAKATIGTSAKTGGEGSVLSIVPKAGVSLELIGGPEGKDALAKLGFPETRIVVPDAVDDDAPTVRPGGSYGLGLSPTLGLATSKDAAFALGKINDAISFSQTGYRSLYWDDSKAALANSYAYGSSGGASSRQQAQLAQYQAALARLSTPNTSIGF